MIIIFLIIALLALSYGLARATDLVVGGIEKLGEGTAFEAYGLTTLLVSLATSLPELFVAVLGAMRGNNGLALGIVMGSNIANISLIIGGAVFIAGTVKARDKVFWRDVLYAFLIGVMPFLLLFDGNLSRFDGAVLLLVYLIFSLINLTGKKRKDLEEVEHEYYEDRSIGHRILSFVGRKDTEKGLLQLLVGSVILIVFSDWIVRLAEIIATDLGIPSVLVGLFMVSIGTSLPELAFELKTVAKKEYMMAFGNIIGSTVLNSSLVLGMTSVIQPITLQENSSTYYISVLAFILIYALFWSLTRTKRRLDRVEGLFLVGAYFIFVLFQLSFFKA